MSGRTEAGKRHRLGPIRTRPHPAGSPGRGVFEGNFGFLPPEFVWEKSLNRHFHGLWAPTGTTIGPKEKFFGHCEIGKNPPRKDISAYFDVFRRPSAHFVAPTSLGQDDEGGRCCSRSPRGADGENPNEFGRQLSPRQPAARTHPHVASTCVVFGLRRQVLGTAVKLWPATRLMLWRRFFLSLASDS